ncbi:NAD(P)H-dependent oxidoreductase [Apibacter adventoris]|uniref:NAD(P)H-dependent oxidoreductase n=1 Tax=Apibacter adventoris TaxID=1679466 RepID=A0A2S8AG80_9FLAO|nr:NAD(P)H-dependent oxidoreductase [Apibacter adventoris]PQL95384.1 NAD(P)H-dependent oxidoreductase [Apibacter adventoris]
MNFLNIAENRYTTKKYNPNKKITEEKIEDLKKILRLCPSSINCQPWKFIFISDEKLKKQLAEVSYWNEHKIKEASHLVIFTAIDDIAKLENQMKPYLPEGSITFYKEFIKTLPESGIKSWMQHQVYLSLGFFLSACACMEIDSTPMEGINKEKYAEIVKTGEYKPLFAVAIGYRDENDHNQPSISPKSRLSIEKIIQSL